MDFIEGQCQIHKDNLCLSILDFTRPQFQKHFPYKHYLAENTYQIVLFDKNDRTFHIPDLDYFLYETEDEDAIYVFVPYHNMVLTVQWFESLL